MISTFAFFHPIPFSRFGLQPIVYFYIAIVLELTLFAIGLGKQLKENLKEKYELQVILRQTKREMQIKTLRGQLNSHFILNVLNSIKAFIIEKEVDEAADYLSRFSQFMRDMLESSHRETCTLRAELDTVLLYADIENMRLSNTLEIKLEVEEGIDLEAYLLPTMVLQPFVENAIWHGLSKSPKPNKNLFLKVKKQFGVLSIIIEDNGQGYATTKFAAVNPHIKSYGISIVRQHLQQFNEKHNQPLDFTIEDVGGGTRVHFTIGATSQ